MAASASKLIGSSAPFRRLLRDARLVARVPEPILIMGPTGSGKETIARLTHESMERGGPFISVACNAPGDVVMMKLFGHGGATYTDPVGRPGLLEEANGGTLFLDEVADLDMKTLAALLSVLDSGRVSRLGATRDSLVDLRIIAATSRDLRQLVAEGRFSEDLYFRLSKQLVIVPSLKERGYDVVQLARHNLHLASERYGRTIRLSHAAARAIQSLEWPGNVLEVEQMMLSLARSSRRVTPQTVFQAAGKDGTGEQLDPKPSLLESIEARGPVRAADLRRERGGSRTTVWRHLEELVDEQLIERREDGPRTYFVPLGFEGSLPALTSVRLTRKKSSSEPRTDLPAENKADPGPLELEQILFDHIADSGSLSPRQAAMFLEKSASAAKRLLYRLEDKGMVRGTGETRNRRYWPLEQAPQDQRASDAPPSESLPMTGLAISPALSDSQDSAIELASTPFSNEQDEVALVTSITDVVSRRTLSLVVSEAGRDTDPPAGRYIALQGTLLLPSDLAGDIARLPPEHPGHEPDSNQAIRWESDESSEKTAVPKRGFAGRILIHIV